MTLLHARPLHATGLQVCPGKDVTRGDADSFNFQWRDMVPLPGERTHVLCLYLCEQASQ